MKHVALIFSFFVLLSPILEAKAALFPPNSAAPIKDGNLMVRLGDLQEYPGQYSKKLKGKAYFATVVVERSDLKIEEGKMLYDCSPVLTPNREASLQCEDIQYIRPQKR